MGISEETEIGSDYLKLKKEITQSIESIDLKVSELMKCIPYENQDEFFQGLFYSICRDLKQ